LLIIPSLHVGGSHEVPPLGGATRGPFRYSRPMKRLFLTVVMLLMGMALVGGAAASLVGTALIPLDQQVGTHTSAAGAVLGIGLMAAAINPAANIGWVRAVIRYGIVFLALGIVRLFRVCSLFY